MKMILALMVTLVMPSDDRVPVDDEFDEHNSSAFTSPCALHDLEIYDVTSRPQE